LLLTLSGRRMETINRNGRSMTIPRGGEVQVFEAATGKPATPRLSLPEGVRRAAFSPDGSRVYTANETQARLWDTATGQPVTPVLTQGDREPWVIRAQSFSADGKQLFLAHDSGTWPPGPSLQGNMEAVTRGWDAQTGQPLGEPRKLPVPLSHRTVAYFV